MAKIETCDSCGAESCKIYFCQNCGGERSTFRSCELPFEGTPCPDCGSSENVYELDEDEVAR